MATRKIAVLVGSLRKESYTRKLARSLMLAAPPTLELDIVDISQLPLYNQDDETDTPPATWTEFRSRIREADGVLFCTPEYNRSLPGALKNAIDVGSRPYGEAAWTGKPCAVVSNSPGALGGFGANHAIRQCLVFLNMSITTTAVSDGTTRIGSGRAGNVTAASLAAAVPTVTPLA